MQQAKTIEELYETENCIIIGRCSDFILKDKPGVISVFIYSTNKEFKINRKMKFDKLTLKEATKKIDKVDKERANYYNHFTNQTWGDKKNYDLTIDSEKLGVDATIDMLEDYINNRLK